MSAQKAGDTLAGILIYSAGVFFFAVNDALGKWLVADFSVAQVMALRGLGAVLVLAPTLVAARARFRGPHRWGLQIARVACSALDTYCFYFATKSLPLADVMTFYLAAPLIVVALSALILREHVGANRWAAVGFGFCGVLIVLHPTGEALSPAALVALLGCVMFALTVTITRQLRATPWLELVSVQVVGSGLVGAVLAPIGWVMPTAVDLGLLALVGIVSMGCFMCITRALSMAPASLLAPFQYMSIVWAAILGWLVWGDVPGPSVVIGSLVIIGSGLFVVRRQRVAAAA